MKDIVFKALTVILLQSTFVASPFAQESKKVDFNFNGYKVENNKYTTLFQVYSEEERSCDLTFWALPAEDAEGNFSSYAVEVNRTESADKITFNQPGWQTATTKNCSVKLIKGNNTIAFVSNGKDFPQIRNIKIFDGKNNIAPMRAANEIRTFSSKEESINTTDGSGYNYLYRPGVSFNQPYSYTFFLPLYYKSGDRASFYGPTANDPSYGRYESTVEYNVYLFNENPELFSESNTSNNKYLYWQVEIPYTGLYYLLVEAKYSGVSGGVTLLIDGNMMYRHSIVSNTTCYVAKDAPKDGFHTQLDSCYHIFTVNNRACDEYHDADPCLWLKKRETDGTEVIVAYNDNNNIPCDYEWGKNARISTKLSGDPGGASPYTVLLSSTSPLYFANDTCDLYHSCWSTPLEGEGNLVMSYFPKLRRGDVIESGGQIIVNYNCIAWTLGINNTIVFPNPVDNNIEWFDKLYNNEYVLTGYGWFKRPEGALKYTREGATEENSVIDIWGVEQEDSIILTHGSIRKNSDGIPHGYDWESKIGINSQIFHPRYALREGVYGNVVAHYRIADNQSVNSNSVQGRAAISTINGEFMEDNIFLPLEEERILDSELNSLPITVKEEFDGLYYKWKEFVDSHSYLSDIWHYTKCIEYDRLLSFINSHKGSVALVYDKFVRKDFMASALIKGLTTTPNTVYETIWNNLMNDRTVRTSRANITLFIKSALQEQKKEIAQQLLNNNKTINITTEKSLIKIDTNAGESLISSVLIMNLITNRVIEISPIRKLSNGMYTDEYTVEPGIYSVTYTIDNNTKSKKVVVL